MFQGLKLGIVRLLYSLEIRRKDKNFKLVFLDTSENFGEFFIVVRITTERALI